MAQRRKGDEDHNKAPEQNKKLRPSTDPHRAPGTVPQEARDRGTPPEETETPLSLGYKGVITLRRFKIKPEKKRRDYVQRLENIVSICEAALSDPDSVQEVQLKAADVIIRAIRMSYTIVKEVDIENLERQTREIKRSLKERDQESEG